MTTVLNRIQCELLNLVHETFHFHSFPGVCDSCKVLNFTKHNHWGSFNTAIKNKLELSVVNPISKYTLYSLYTSFPSIISFNDFFLLYENTKFKIITFNLNSEVFLKLFPLLIIIDPLDTYFSKKLKKKKSKDLKSGKQKW